MTARGVLALAFIAVSSLSFTACGSSDDGPSEKSLTAFCHSFVAFQETAATRGSDKSVAGAQKTIDAMAASLGQVARDAPEEIRSDAEETRDWFDGASEAVAGAGSVKEVEALGTRYTATTPQPTAAVGVLDAYAAKNCKRVEPATD